MHTRRRTICYFHYFPAENLALQETQSVVMHDSCLLCLLTAGRAQKQVGAAVYTESYGVCVSRGDDASNPLAANVVTDWCSCDQNRPGSQSSLCVARPACKKWVWPLHRPLPGGVSKPSLSSRTLSIDLQPHVGPTSLSPWLDTCLTLVYKHRWGGPQKTWSGVRPVAYF